jgi:hypothetical protein
MTPPKGNNSTKTDSNDSEMAEMADKELKRMSLRMINEIKGEYE